MHNQQGRESKSGGNRRHYQQAWAPYNFVPMPDKPLYAELQHTDDTQDENRIPQRHDEYTAGRHTGYFDVKLTTETPLFVRGMLTITEQEAGIETRKNPNAFSINRQHPVIPGSSLRGMIRTLVEIATNSKMHFVSDNKLVYRAIYYTDALVSTYRGITTDVLGSKEFIYPSRRMQGGYLQKGDSESGWVIQRATAYYGETIALVDRQNVIDAKIPENPKLKVHQIGVRPPTTRIVHAGKEGVQLHIAQADSIHRQPGSGYEPAALLISNTVGRIGGKGSNRRWYPAIYAADPNAEPIPISQRIWDDFIKDRDLKRGIDNRKLENPGDVLFYLLDHQGELLFFGPTMFFRVPYVRSISSMMPDDMQKGRNPQFDYAEALFGYVSEKNEVRKPAAYAGRVSVTSATVTEESPYRNDPFDETIIPKILSSPKPTTFQHYLKQLNGWQTPTHQLRHYNDDTQIRGYKLYWRQMIADLKSVKEPDDGKNPDTSTQHTIIKPVRNGVQFSFKVYFDNLSDAELGTLMWVLTFDGDSEARHQLGMGKPFGLGVVKLEPELVLTSRHERAGRYGKLFNPDGSWFTDGRSITSDEQSEYVEAFKNQFTDFDGQNHIQELLALVRCQEPTPLFQYMQIEGRDENGEKINQYQGRPVLPYPSEVLEQVESQRREFEAQAQERLRQQRHQQTQQFRTRIQKEGLIVSDVIEGAVFDYSGGKAWFEPQKVYFGENTYNIEKLTNQVYEAELVGSASANEGSVVRGRITRIDSRQNPIILICEPVE